MTRIHVTQRDIDEGEPENPNACPIARAITRKFKAENAYVTASAATIDGSYYPLPVEASDFVNDFDAGYDVEPFVFVL